MMDKGFEILISDEIMKMFREWSSPRGNHLTISFSVLLHGRMTITLFRATLTR